MIISQNVYFLLKMLINYVKILFNIFTTDNIESNIDNNECNNNSNFEESEYLFIPSNLNGFINISTDTVIDKNKRTNYIFNGTLSINDDDYICKECGCKMHINGSKNVKLKHLPIGNALTFICFPHVQFECQHCHITKMQDITFKCDNHFITKELCVYIKDLLAAGNYTNVEVSQLTGVNRNIVKDIDMERLEEKYTIDGKELIKPERQAVYLGIDEFKLHNGYKYATHIIDLETGHILWIQEGKKKQVVYDFIDHVGEEWMKNVVAVACDMNSDFEEAFVERCPHIKIVFDHFHIINNFNDKVIGKIRKDEQNRLEEEGKIEEAKTLKRSKYILTSSKENLEKKDEEAKKNKVISKGNELFKKQDVIRKGGKIAKYEQILEENKLLFTADLIKEKLHHAYTLDNINDMKKEIDEIIKMCEDNGNEHFIWFAKLLRNHYDGIISHAIYPISNGKIEGINNKIKTLRRQAYGYPDDKYFFLKLFDISRAKRK